MKQIASLGREVLATYQEAEDLITIGAYKAGQNPKVDRAVALYEPLVNFLRQRSVERAPLEESWKQLAAILTSYRPAQPQQTKAAQPANEGAR